MRFLVVFVLLLVSGLAPAVEAPGKSLVVGSEQDYPPFATGTSDETAGGFTVELWKAVAAESGITYSIRVRPFHQILREFREGKIDVLINLAQSDERRQFADFTVPNVIVNGAIFVRKGDRRISSEADLAGKSIIVLNADLAHDYARSRGWEKQLVLVETAADGFKLLASGQHDAMLLSKLAGLQTLAKLGLSNISTADKKAGFSQKFSFAVHKGESDLLARINEGLSLTKSRGIYDAAYEKWFAVYEEQDILSRLLLKYGTPAAVFLLVVAALFILRRRNERKLAAEALRDSEARLQLALQASNDGWWDWDLRSGLAHLSPRYYEIAGQAAVAAIPYLDFFKRLVHAEDLPRVLDCMDANLAGKTAEFNVEFRLVSPSGITRWVHGKGKVVERADSGAPLRMAGTISDITERKRAEQQLRKLSLAVEQSPENIVITNTAAEIEYINEAFTRTTGYRLDEVVGQNPRILRSGRTPPETHAALWQALRHGQTWKGEFYNKRKDGSEYTEFAIVAPIREADGRITHYVAVKEDVSEKKRIAEELDRYRHHLEELVGQRTAELAQARDVAQAASRAKSAFLANMSHEIRTPLNGVLGLAHIGVRDGAAPPKTRDTFARIIESGKLLLGVINDILDFSKIEAGKLDVERIETRLGEVVERAVDLCAERAYAKGLALVIDKAADLPAVCLSDPLRLQQILLNLLSNAIKFTERGKVVLRASQRGEQLRFEVSDSGIGMSAEQVARVFAPFEQADTSTTRRFGGTGLGLAITHRLVELLGGRIAVDSTPGLGSHFTVILPYHAATAAAGPGPDAAPAGRPAAGRRLAGLTVLVAEDNRINQMIIEELLVSEGATVALAGNGREVVDAVVGRGAAAFDLVLMDVQMPQMDGYEATRRIRQLAPDLPIVGQSAHAMAEERGQCLAAGMVDHIAKPIDPEELVAAVRRNAAGPKRPALAPRIEWDDSFSVGVKEFDRHHQVLARLINRCSRTVAAGSEIEAVADMLNELVGYATYHFAYEEKRLAECHYAGLDEQIADHAEFSRVMAEACYETIHGRPDLVQLLDYLNSWWRHHILQVDMRYKPLFNSEAVG